MTNPILSRIIGRSFEADAIYKKFIDYSTEVDKKIQEVDALPYNQRMQSDVEQGRSDLISLKEKINKEYQAAYTSDTATVHSFAEQCTALMLKTYTAAVAVQHAQQTPVAPPSPPAPEKKSAENIPNISSNSAPKPSVAIAEAKKIGAIAPSTLPGANLENGTWYITWSAVNYPIPEGVDLVNIFVGTMRMDASGKPSIGGFEAFSQEPEKMKAFAKACHDKGITVKISLGGGGGAYDNCWDLLTKDNVKAFALELATFCRDHSIDGVDFDVEKYQSAKDNPQQQALIGTFIKHFKEINPNFQTSLCTNAGFGEGFEWKGIVQNILNGATEEKTCAVDKLYIMSYFDPIENEKRWIDSWADWLKKEYAFKPSQVTVGINSETTAYDPQALATWAAAKGYSTSHWKYNPAQPEQSKKQTTAILEAYTKAKK